MKFRLWLWVLLVLILVDLIIYDGLVLTIKVIAIFESSWLGFLTNLIAFNSELRGTLSIVGQFSNDLILETKCVFQIILAA